MNRYNAAIAAGYSVSMAKSHTKMLEAKVERDLRDVFEQKGLTDNALVEYALEALKAVKLQTCDIYVKDDNGKLQINKNSNDFIEIPDWHARHKFFATIMELTGRIKTKIEHSGKVEGPEQKIVIVYPPDWKPKDERESIESASKRISG